MRAKSAISTIVLLLALLTFPAAAVEYGWPNSKGRYVEAMQFAGGALSVPPTGGSAVATTSCPAPLGRCDALPYAVPADRCLVITNIYWASKFPNSGRASYLGVGPIGTIIDAAPLWIGRWVLFPGDTLTAGFINNETMTPDNGGSVYQQLANVNGTSDHWAGTLPGLGGEPDNMQTVISGFQVDCPLGPSTNYRRALDGLTVP